MNTLVTEMYSGIELSKKHNLTPVFRLNGTSDIRWEIIPVNGHQNIMSMFPDIMFYDYTKIPNRRNLPVNYRLTFSLADGNDESARQAMANGHNVAVVFRTSQFPKIYFNRPVINGDENDLRFLDPAGVIVGLRAKGHAINDVSGFVR